MAGRVYKRRLRIVILLILLVPLSLFSRSPENRTWQTNIGPLFNFAKFKYDCVPKAQGYLAGIHFDAEHSMPSYTYLGARFDGRWNAGSVAGCRQKSEIKDYRTEFNIGYNSYNGEDCNFRFTPFLGLGFFFLSFENECSILTNRYYNLFVPVGFKFESLHHGCFSWGLNAEYRIDAWTRIRQDVTSYFSLCNEMEQLEHRTKGVLVEVPLTWVFNEDACVEYQVKVVPLFDWNRFSRTVSCRSSSSFDCCSSSERIFDTCEPILCYSSNTCKPAAPMLTQWYLGLHVDLGVRF